MLTDATVSIERLAVMLDVPDTAMREGMVSVLRESLSADNVEVVVVETSRDPRPERIAQIGANADASAVLFAGTTSMLLGDETVTAQTRFGEKAAATQAFTINLTLYGVDAQRRIWTATTSSQKKGRGQRTEIGREVAQSAVQAMRDDGLLSPR
ncbi:MAG: hypothetical protein AAF089_01880 [Bacteroidota bacterium]